LIKIYDFYYSQKNKGVSILHRENIVININGEEYDFPFRYYPEYTSLSNKLINTLKKYIKSVDYINIFHCDGVIRENTVKRILRKKNMYQMETALILYSLGDYVYQTTELIASRIEYLNTDYIYEFIVNNLELYEYIKSRVISYWNTHYRYSDWFDQYKTITPKLKDYETFQAIEYIEETMKNKYGMYVKNRKIMFIN